jgi:hypothetical protein
MNRVLYLASPRAQPEGQKVLDKLLEVIGQMVASDEQPKKTRRLYSGMKSWKETACEHRELAYA